MQHTLTSINGLTETDEDKRCVVERERDPHVDEDRRRERGEAEAGLVALGAAAEPRAGGELVEDVEDGEVPVERRRGASKELRIPQDLLLLLIPLSQLLSLEKAMEILAPGLETFLTDARRPNTYNSSTPANHPVAGDGLHMGKPGGLSRERGPMAAAAARC